MEAIRILGTGSYVPPKVLSNVDIEKMGLDTSDEWIVQRTGIKERRMADPDVNTSDLAYEASLRALDMAGLSSEDLDFIIELFEAGKLVPAIDKRYPLNELAEAFRYFEEGHCKGKIVK